MNTRTEALKDCCLAVAIGIGMTWLIVEWWTA